MDNKITINAEDVLKMADGSIMDAELIRQIGLLADKRLYQKIHKGFEYAALYPHVMHVYNIMPELS